MGHTFAAANSQSFGKALRKFLCDLTLFCFTHLNKNIWKKKKKKDFSLYAVHASLAVKITNLTEYVDLFSRGIGVFII